MSVGGGGGGSSSSGSAVYYETQSVCPQCLLLDRKGTVLCDAQVERRDGRVFLVIRCMEHGEQAQLYCKDPVFFERVIRVGEENQTFERVTAIEDLAGKPADPPLAIDLAIFEREGFVPNYILRQRVDTIHQLFEEHPNRRYVVKILGGVTDDTDTMNDQIEFVADLLSPRALIVVELSFERMMLIASRENSVFLNQRLHPCVKYYVEKGDETQAIRELRTCLRELSKISNLRLVVCLGVSRPMPDLSSLLSFLRDSKGIVPMIILSMERSASELGAGVMSMKEGCAGTNPDSRKGAPLSLDPVCLLEEIERSTGGEIGPADFFPLSCGSVMEPFIKLFGHGSFCIRPSPLCGFGTVLFNTEEHRSVPCSRFLNVEELYRQFKPMLPKLLAKDKIGLFQGRKIKKSVQQSLIPNSGVPANLFSYFTKASKSEDLHRFVSNSQILIVHNRMDLVGLDAVRRQHCAYCSCSEKTASGLSAVCTHGAL